MPRTNAPPARGLLKTSPVPGQHHRWLPSDDLSAFVEHFWFVSWNLCGHSDQEVATLPHPSVHMVFERGHVAEIVGVHTRRFVRRLNGHGHVFGIKFKPGGFHTFYKNDLLHLRNRHIPIESVFGERGMELSEAITNNIDNEQWMQLAEQFLRGCLPSVDHSLKQTTDIVALMSQDKTIASINQISEQCGIGIRQLQRLFCAMLASLPSGCCNVIGSTKHWHNLVRLPNQIGLSSPYTSVIVIRHIL